MLWLVLTSAHASDVDLFDPAATLPTGQGTLQGEAPLPGQTGATAGVLVAYSSDPVVHRFEDGSEDPAVTALVPITLQAGFAIENRVRFDLALPVYGWIDAPINNFSGSAAGDLRLQSTVRLWRNRHLAFALVPRLVFPTGDSDALVGGGWAGGLLASLGGTNASWGWLANAGFLATEADTLPGASVPIGSRLEGLVGGWWRTTDALRLGAEIDGELGLATGPDGANHTAAIHLFAQHYLPSGLGLTVGAGTGLVSGVGTPSYRVLAGVSWTSHKADADADGIVDGDDRCPLQAEDVDQFADEDGCPERDNDADGVDDLADHCVVDAEDIDGWDDDDGCPDTDNDEDGLADVSDLCPDADGPEADRGCPDADGDGLVLDDACPDVAGPRETMGCPDRDSDLVEDTRDQCPDLPRPFDEDPAESDGCPKTVYVTTSEVRITQRVEFDTGSSRLSEASFVLLDEVARVILATPAIDRVEVQGHTDSVGSESINLALSQQRASAVVAYLMDVAGVPPSQLVARGYGESRPMSTNRTPNGREKNRRVQFVLVPNGTSVAHAAAPPHDPPRTAPNLPPPSNAPRQPSVELAPTPTTAAAAVVATRPPAPAPTHRAPPKPAPPSGPPGLLTVKVYGGNWGLVFVDGQRLVKSAPFTAQQVPSGDHLVRVENSKLGLGWEQNVTIAPGAETTLIVPLPGGSASP